MGIIKRAYSKIVQFHLDNYDEMIFLSGPRQVGKTTIANDILENYGTGVNLNWDIEAHRIKIVKGQKAVRDYVALIHSSEKAPLIIFDEIHKMPNWQNWIKGFFDAYKGSTKVIVTGSSKLDVYSVDGDSMAGRYFHYMIHPFSVGELLGRNDTTDSEIHPPSDIGNHVIDRLVEFGGFPKPYVKGNKRFYNHWTKQRNLQFFRQEIRDRTNIVEVAQLEKLATILALQVGGQTSVASLARKVRASDITIKRWLETLRQFYYCFELKPWSKNISRSLIKEPKYYLWNWAQVNDRGGRIENFVASHLYKSVQFWEDSGLGKYGLYYIKDKLKREVDFVVTRDDKPWFIVEVKSSDKIGISPALRYFHEELKTEHAFQVAFDKPYTDVDLFKINRPSIVSAGTFLSQLV